MAGKSAKKSESHDEQFQGPDGGYGWVIVICTYIILFLSYGMAYSIGIFFEPIVNEFQCLQSEVTLAVTIAYGLQLFFAPLAGYFQHLFPTRWVVSCGIVLVATSMISSAFAPSVYVLYVTYGVIKGLGMSMIYLPVNVLISFYFKNRRGIAIALGVIGGYSGGFFLPFFMQFLIRHFGWRGAIFLLGAVSLNGLPAALFLLPVSTYEKRKGSRRNVGKNCEIGNGDVNDDDSKVKQDDEAPLHRQEHHMNMEHPFESLGNLIASTDELAIKVEEQLLSSRSPKNSRAEIETEPESEVNAVALFWITQAQKVLDILYPYFKHFINPRFTAFLIADLCRASMFYTPGLFIVSYGKSLGYSDEQATWLLSMVGIGNIIGRPLMAFVADLFVRHRIILLAGMMLCTGVVTLAIVPFTYFYLLMLYVFQFGFNVGAAQTLLAPIVADLVPLNELAFAFGVILGAEGFCTIFGPPLLGLMPEYSMCFALSGVVLLVSAAILTGVYSIDRCCQRKKTNDETPRSVESQNSM